MLGGGSAAAGQGPKWVLKQPVNFSERLMYMG